jgi:hypothetical protein
MPLHYAGGRFEKPDFALKANAAAGFSHIRYPGDFAQL